MNQAATSVSRLERLVPLLKSEPENLPLHRECVELAMRGGEYARALELVEARLVRHPSESETLYARTNALIGLTQYAEALPLLKLLEEQGVAQLAVWQNLATCHYMLGQYENSRAYSERLIATGEQAASVTYIVLSSLHHLGKMDEAVKFADACAEAAAKDGPLAGACAMVYLDVEQNDKAAKFAAVALAGNPDNLAGLTVQATLAASNLDSEQAFRQYSRIIELSPDNGRAWLGLGLLAMLAMDFAKAQELLRRATEIMPGHLGSWHSLAWSHFFAQDLAGAEKYFAHALEIDRNFGESHGAMAAMHAIKGDLVTAEREIEIAEKLDRRGASAQFARAMMIARTQGPEASRGFIQNAVRAMATQVGGKPGELLTKLLDRK